MTEIFAEFFTSYELVAQGIPCLALALDFLGSFSFFYVIMTHRDVSHLPPRHRPMQSPQRNRTYLHVHVATCTILYRSTGRYATGPLVTVPPFGPWRPSSRALDPLPAPLPPTWDGVHVREG